MAPMPNKRPPKAPNRHNLAMKLRDVWAQDPTWCTTVAEVAALYKVSRPTAQRVLQELTEAQACKAVPPSGLDRTIIYARNPVKAVNRQARRVQILVEAFAEADIRIPVSQMPRLGKYLAKVSDDDRALRIVRQVAADHPGAAGAYALVAIERIAARGGHLARPAQKVATSGKTEALDDRAQALDRMLFGGGK